MKKNWLAQWFRILHERGQTDWLPFIELDLVTGEQWDYSFFHREKDGAVIISECMRRRGIPMPPMKPMAKPGFFRMIGCFLQGMRINGHQPPPAWKELHRNLGGKPPKLLWLLLPTNVQTALMACAKQRKISNNALILHHMVKATSAHLMTSDGGSWMMPVNMRGAFPDAPLEGVQVSYLPLRIGTHTDAANIHAQIREGFKRQLHWATWAVGHIGMLVGLRGMRYLSRKSSQRVFWVGSYSDVGDWTPATPLAPEHQNLMWVAVPPGSPNNPIGCASFIWNGRRSLALSIHPSILPERNAEVTAEILRDFATRLGADIGVDPTLMTVKEVIGKPAPALAPVP